MTTKAEAKQIADDAIKLAEDLNPLFEGKDSRVVLGAISFHLANWSRSAKWTHARVLEDVAILMDGATFVSEHAAQGEGKEPRHG